MDKQFVQERKKGHLDQIVSIAVHPDNDEIVATTGYDNTVRIWDFRMPQMGKFFRCYKGQMANCAFSKDGTVYFGVGKGIYRIDTRKEGIILKEIMNVSYKHYDYVNHVTVDGSCSYVAACDDEGDTRVYDRDLGLTHLLDQEHSCVSFCTEFINPEQYKQPVCVTTSFDLKMAFWSLETSKVLKQIDFGALMGKYAEMHCPPYIYTICPMKSSVIVGTESGHIVHIPFSEPKKPKFVMTASLAKIQRCCFGRFQPNCLIAIAADSTFSLFDFIKRDNFGCPYMIVKCKTSFEPNWIESTKKSILVADKSDCLSIFNFKG